MVLVAADIHYKSVKKSWRMIINLNHDATSIRSAGRPVGLDVFSTASFNKFDSKWVGICTNMTAGGAWHVTSQALLEITS